jgi:CPA2 family monovalent cation:H+ antiporter-2
MGWSIGAGLIFGLALSVASTVVLLKALEDRRMLDSDKGRIAVGWLIVEDLFTVVVLVLLPTIAPLLGGTVEPASGSATGGGLGPVGEIVLALVKAVAFAALMIVAGARLVPWLLVMVARDGSRELFTLAVLAIALGIAFLASAVFGVSFALGAFLAGAVVGESDMSHQAAADALPLRDAFAVLFFVSVGMLLDPAVLLAAPLAVLAIVLLVVVAKSVAAFAIVAVFGYPTRTGLTVAAGLAQVGEFSFILGTLGLDLGLLPAEGFQLIVAAALLSIALNPFLFRAVDPLEQRLRDVGPLVRLRARGGGGREMLPDDVADELRQHAIVCGYGPVGRLIGPALERRGFRYVVVTQQRDEVDRLRERGMAAIYGDPARDEVLELAHVERARVVIVATADPHDTRRIVEHVRARSDAVDIVVRTHSDEEANELRAIAPKVQAVHGERELAVQMARYSLRRFGVSTAEAESIAQGLRVRPARSPDAVMPAGGGSSPFAGLARWIERLRSGG